ncbi:MAG: hypothetical protein CMJ20_05650 [Phycisphaeraceae bacterium]|nr:hypothetical protein [Phycisphaeraceae bacterium]|tara:strand:- start:799 stop:1791 length:993 start_codon:yes stop_codon:yes gene_type:complete
MIKFQRFLVAMVALATVPAFADIATFQQGVNGYTRGLDTTIRVTNEMNNLNERGNLASGIKGGDLGAYEHHSTNGGASTKLEVGHFMQNQVGFSGNPGPTMRYSRSMIRFRDVFGDGPGQVPTGSPINSATLTLYHTTDNGAEVSSSGNMDNPGTAASPQLNSGQIKVVPLISAITYGTSDGLASVGEVVGSQKKRGKVDWEEGCVAGDGPGGAPNNDPYGPINSCGPFGGSESDFSRGSSYAQAAVTGPIDIDVTDILGDLESYGILLNLDNSGGNKEVTFENNNGAAYFSNEAADAQVRPLLTVDYVPEPATLGLLAIGGLTMLRRRR